jgi:hypothetical protein
VSELGGINMWGDANTPRKVPVMGKLRYPESKRRKEILRCLKMLRNVSSDYGTFWGSIVNYDYRIMQLRGGSRHHGMAHGIILLSGKINQCLTDT